MWALTSIQRAFKASLAECSRWLRSLHVWYSDATILNSIIPNLFLGGPIARLVDKLLYQLPEWTYGKGDSSKNDSKVNCDSSQVVSRLHEFTEVEVRAVEIIPPKQAPGSLYNGRIDRFIVLARAPESYLEARANGKNHVLPPIEVVRIPKSGTVRRPSIRVTQELGFGVFGPGIGEIA